MASASSASASASTAVTVVTAQKPLFDLTSTQLQTLFSSDVLDEFVVRLHSSEPASSDDVDHCIICKRLLSHLDPQYTGRFQTRNGVTFGVHAPCAMTACHHPQPTAHSVLGFVNGSYKQKKCDHCNGVLPNLYCIQCHTHQKKNKKSIHLYCAYEAKWWIGTKDSNIFEGLCHECSYVDDDGDGEFRLFTDHKDDDKQTEATISPPRPPPPPPPPPSSFSTPQSAAQMLKITPSPPSASSSSASGTGAGAATAAVRELIPQSVCFFCQKPVEDFQMCCPGCDRRRQMIIDNVTVYCAKCNSPLGPITLVNRSQCKQCPIALDPPLPSEAPRIDRKYTKRKAEPVDTSAASSSSDSELHVKRRRMTHELDLLKS